MKRIYRIVEKIGFFDDPIYIIERRVLFSSGFQKL